MEISDRTALTVLSVVFVIANGLLIASSGPTAQLIEADSLTYQRMALQLVESGDFQEFERQPLYPILMAGMLFLSESYGLELLIGFQVVLLYATGVVAWHISRDFVSRTSACAVFGLVIFNPNATATAHWPLADTLHAALLTLNIEWTDDVGPNPVGMMVNITKRLAKTLALVIARARALACNVTPITLLHWDVSGVGIAIYLARREKRVVRVICPRQLEHVT